MKRIVVVMCLAVVFCIGIGCAKENMVQTPQEKVNVMAQRAIHWQDPRTGNCYLYTGTNLQIECGSIPKENLITAQVRTDKVPPAQKRRDDSGVVMVVMSILLGAAVFLLFYRSRQSKCDSTSNTSIG